MILGVISMKLIIKLMAEYCCYPLWWSGTEVGNIDPATLPLQSALIERLQEWAERYDKTLNQEYPPDSGFPTTQDEIRFEEDGIQLWKELRTALSPKYDVVYRSYRLGKVIAQPEELIT